ncbi:MAG: hypothetical protein ABRQ38_15345 [Candidatus Eremiobacterota bacterium]
MNINKKTIITVICAFVLGVIFSLSLVMVGLWAYRLGRYDYNLSSINDKAEASPAPTKIISQNTYVTNLSTPAVSSTPVYYYTPVTGTAMKTPGVSTVPDNTQIQIVYYATPFPVTQSSPVAAQYQTQNQNNIDSDKRQKIMDYMYSVHNILSASKVGGDPSQFAQQLISSSLEGNTAGFDNLINNYEHTKNQISTLNPPDECKEYHNGCVSIIDNGIILLKEVKEGIASQDINSLLAVQGKASSIEQESKRVDSIGIVLLQKYNIPEPR